MNNEVIMLLEEIKQTFRRLLNQKTFTSINVIGLSLGLVFSILAFLYAQNEFKVDKHFTNTNDVYRLACNNGRSQTQHFGQPFVFSEAILRTLPEIESGMRLKWSDENIKVGEQRFIAKNFIYADSNFFSFIGWPLINGDINNALSAPMSVTISENMAKQLFKSENPIGKIINIENEYDMTITGVFKNIPEQSHLATDFIASNASLKTIAPNYFGVWGWHNSGVYLRFSPNADIAATENKIAEVWNKESKDRACTGPHIKAILQPFSEHYLKYGKVVGGTSPIDYVIGFTIIALFILIISCFNFINLSIAIHSKRSVEHGIKKVLGANLLIFTRQVFIEVISYLIIALAVSMIVIKITLPYLAIFLGKSISFSLLFTPSLMLYLAIVLLGVLIICGLVPLLQMVNAKTSGQLKGRAIFNSNSSSPKKQIYIRNLLVITQFAIGILLVISAITVNKQLQLIRQHDAGFDKEQILVIDNYEGDFTGRYNTFSDIALQCTGVKAISAGSDVPLYGISNWGGPRVMNNEQTQMQGCGFVSIDNNYLDLIGAELMQGRNFKNGGAEKDYIIINESLAKALSLENPIGTKLDDLWDNTAREIIGVVKDIEFNTIHNSNIPLLFFNKRSGLMHYQNIILVKLEPGNIKQTLATLSENWKSISPDYQMQYTFLDDKFNETYQKEAQTATLLNIMTIVAIVLCCLGLFGLALFNINNKIKEIGIRKVNGATIFEILQLLNKEFVVWVIGAFVLATPLAYYIMNNWLNNFAYRTEISWWIFAISGFSALAIALLTVSLQTFRAAKRNPVEALRYE
ncbi:MAG: ABC transporter permease [Salinivirgaceae bacterium]|jgi:putative ABC transport system permease protein|nr:ABC transporter permease [Salinivirgaceae bacterium]